ncbi:protein KASH5 isoform X3 [Catharus ustulatus]|uniref:protein KASH5 isoform X3 n=1 Tax=Catharus ustulatus TaxID=91951 RepID=UPI00140CB8BC|nr:protein KASH5 isoform X3 [Catharus ustulatus]
MVAAAKLTRNGHRRARPLGLPRDGAAAAGGGVRGGDDGAQRARRAAAGAAAGAGPRGRGDGAGLGPVPHGHGRLDRGVPAGRVGAERWDSAPGRLNRPAGLTCGCPRRAEEQDTATGDTGPVLAGGCWHGKRESGWPQWGHEHSPLCPVPQRTTDTHPQQPPSSRVTTRTPPARKCPLRGHPAIPGRAPRSTLGSVALPSSAEAAGLRSRARQLAAQNTKLQRDAEQAEELNTRLAEEIAQLQAQLRSSRQALEQARVAIEELDDMKAMVKGLEEENTELRRQARHAVRGQAEVPPGVTLGVTRCPLMAMPSPGEGAAQPVLAGRGSAGGEPAAPRRGPGTAGADPGAGSPDGQPGGEHMATAGGAGAVSHGDEVSLSPSLCPGPALPWYCPAFCPGHSPGPGERCPVTLPARHCHPQPCPTAPQSRPCPTGRAAGTGADSSTGGIRADGAGTASGDDAAAPAAGPAAGRLGHVREGHVRGARPQGALAPSAQHPHPPLPPTGARGARAASRPSRPRRRPAG